MALLALLAALVPRLAVFPFNEYVHGDAVPRVELAEAWAQAPHVIRSFGDGAAQYGPLHIYLVGLALEYVDRNDAARIVNLLFGVLTVVPLVLVTSRYFGVMAALWAGLAFAAWGLHVQASTAGGSEAVALALMWAALGAMTKVLDRPGIAALSLLAIAMTLATATRYDAWMYIPLLGLMPLLEWQSRGRAIGWGLAVIAVCIPFPVWWMSGNLAAHADALYPLRYIDAYHAEWASRESAGLLRRLWFQLQGLGFWPAMALATLSPGIAVLGTYGMWAAWRERIETRWLIVAALVPASYYTVRAAMLVDFVPLARFTVLQLSLLLPFVWFGAERLAARNGRAWATTLTRWTWIAAVVLPLSLGVVTFRNDHRVARAIAGVSPTSTNPRPVMAAAAFVRSVADGGQTIALDADATYQDIQLAFYARLPNEALRMRWPGFRDAVMAQPPGYVVTFERGSLLAEPWVSREGSTLTMAGVRYVPAQEFASAVTVWRRSDSKVGRR